MIRLHTENGVQVLSFDSTDEARSVGEHLAAMGNADRFYARHDNVSKPALQQAFLSAVTAHPPPGDWKPGEFEELHKRLTA